MHSYRVRWEEADPDPRYAELARKQIEAEIISVPTLVLHGDEDRVVLPDSSKGKEPYFTGGYELVLLPGVGHFPTREAPAQVREGLERFLLEFGRQ
ncbi:MAG: alpha/beta hydrolase [Mesorhizobium sp.]|nr:MAG: alpha/beta hydrolase [Mesorhizobium sp.]